MTQVIADSVRLALPGEATAIATIQRRFWADQATPASRHLLAALTLDDMVDSWQDAIVRPPLAQYRVLVAVADQRIVGFAAIGPSDDPDADPSHDALVAEFVIDPAAQRRGHGSRLLNAVADTLVADGFTRATWWLPSTDDVARTFLAEAGWASDGAYMDTTPEEDGPHLKLIRLHTAIV